MQYSLLHSSSIAQHFSFYRIKLLLVTSNNYKRILCSTEGHTVIMFKDSAIVIVMNYSSKMWETKFLIIIYTYFLYFSVVGALLETK